MPGHDRTTSGRRRRRHRAAASCALAALIAGCSAGDPQRAPAGPSPAPAAPSSASADPVPGEQPAVRFTADPARVPENAAQAEALTDRVAFQPADWGPDFRAEAAPESRPRTVAALDGQCRWQRVPLPPGVLASRSRYAWLPGSAGKGPLRVTAVVTVYATEQAADRELADALEQSLRCPEQQIRDGERVGGLQSAASPFGVHGQQWADDHVIEQGFYATPDGARPYSWGVGRIGAVTIGVSVRGGAGHTPQDLLVQANAPMAGMGERVKARLGREG
ncbi:hypothetical protein C6N75_21695 [Streptomyces solincola]|uniref:PknH-like extracellular domain-containing protein n=1 Tax=Streptomyces solincola TaxID=2100817 RepID=A0A2S9PRX5_9ACTN|nr:hypothetical protein [Streptomyces solincola]PRH77175.1 hypothetical protein C6N75_21695 [Streptomyces solincola]